MSEMKVFFLATQIMEAIHSYEKATSRVAAAFMNDNDEELSSAEAKFWKEEATKLNQELKQLEQGKGE